MAKPAIFIGIGSKPGESDDAKDGVEIPMPDGFSFPDGSDPDKGEKFMCTVAQGPDGKLLLKDLDGLPFDGDKPDEEDSTPDETVEPEGMAAGAMRLINKGPR